MPRLAVALVALASIAASLCGVAQARTGYCRPRTALPAGSYQKTCTCTVESCDYLVCTCDGQTHTSLKITACTSQSFSNANGMLRCD